jgi:hypothetical protein
MAVSIENVSFKTKMNVQDLLDYGRLYMHISPTLARFSDAFLVQIAMHKRSNASSSSSNAWIISIQQCNTIRNHMSSEV